MNMTIRRFQVLLEALEMAEHNVYSYSSDIGMSKPKEGYEDKWKREKAKSEILQQMLDEYPKFSHRDAYGNAVHYCRFIGTFGSWSVKMSQTDPPHQYVEIVRFDVETPHEPHLEREERLFYIDTLCAEILLSGEYDDKRHRRYDAGVSALIAVYVDNTHHIRKVEWVVSDEETQQARQAREAGEKEQESV